MTDWLFSSDNQRLLAAIISFCATIIAATTALWIAYRAYPRQKEADRALQQLSERRDVYRRFLEATNSHLALLNTCHGDKTDYGIRISYLRLIEKASDLAAYAPAGDRNNVLASCQSCYELVLRFQTLIQAILNDETALRVFNANPGNYPKNLFDLVRHARKQTVVAIRIDLGEDPEVANRAASIYFVKTVDVEVSELSVR